MKNIIFAFIILVFSCLMMKASAKDKKNSESIHEKKEYTVAEFEQAVEQELEKRLKRLGHGKVVEFSKELVEKQKELEFKKLDIERREEHLAISSKGFEGRVQEFYQKQEKLLVCLEEVDKKENERINHMVEAFSNMRPQNAADILSVQDPEISIKILGELSSDKVAKIFNLMEKEISARLQKQYLTMKR